MAVAAAIGWAISAYRETKVVAVLQYTKPIGLRPKAPPPDPGAKFKTSSDYLVAIARQCGLPKWELTTNGIAQDADDVGELSVPLFGLPDASFNCLAKFVTPPLITLERVSQ